MRFDTLLYMGGYLNCQPGDLLIDKSCKTT